jgi:hypothetical protein
MCAEARTLHLQWNCCCCTVVPGARSTLVVEAALWLKHCCTACCLKLQAVTVLQAHAGTHTHRPTHQQCSRALSIGRFCTAYRNRCGQHCLRDATAAFCSTGVAAVRQLCTPFCCGVYAHHPVTGHAPLLAMRCTCRLARFPCECTLLGINFWLTGFLGYTSKSSLALNCVGLT